MIQNIDDNTKKIMKEVILKYFILLREIFELLANGPED